MPPQPTTLLRGARKIKASFNSVEAPRSRPSPRPNDLKFLHDAGVPASDGLASKILAERCAAPQWARDSLLGAVDPDTWLTLLTPALLAILQGLYALPPHKGSAPAASIFRRLADVITTYTPDVLAAAGPVLPLPIH